MAQLAPMPFVTTTPPSSIPGREIHLLGALLGEMPEASLLRYATPNPLHIVHEPSRVAVLARLRTGEYDAVVFPILDGHGLPTAPLIQQCAHERSDLALIAICCAPPARAGALLAAARAGARVIVAPSVPELSALLRDISPRVSQRTALARASLHVIEPRFLREALAVATKIVAEGGHVGTFAACLNISTRTLSRQLDRAGLASPHVVLAAARLLWACAVMESVPSRDAATTARLCGFVNTHRLMLAARRYGVPVAGDPRHPSLPRYSDALAAVVHALGGRLDLG